MVLSAREDGRGHVVEAIGENSDETEAVASIGVDEGGSCWGIYYDK